VSEIKTDLSVVVSGGIEKVAGMRRSAKYVPLLGVESYSVVRRDDILLRPYLLFGCAPVSWIHLISGCLLSGVVGPQVSNYYSGLSEDSVFCQAQVPREQQACIRVNQGR
jgi:hypothetical protein